MLRSKSSPRRTPARRLSVAVLLLAAACRSPSAPADVPQIEDPPAPGDPFLRPFNASSPWNTPIAAYDDVRYEPTSALRTFAAPAFSGFSHWLQGNWAAVYRARESDPVITLYYHRDAWVKVARGEWRRWGNGAAVEAEIRAGMTQTWDGYEGNMYSTTDPNGFRMPAVYKRRQDPYWSLQAHVPADAVPPPDADGLMAVYQPNGTVLEMIAPIRLSNGDYVSVFASYTDPEGDGTGTAHGRRASMVPVYGGLIREGELTQGRIDHALCLGVGPEALAREVRWPATAMDRNPTNYSGTLPMGTLLALPPDLSDEALGLRTREARVVADAARRYGMYVVDRSGPRAWLICTEFGARDIPSYSSTMESDMRRIRDALQVVTFSRR